MFNERTKAFKPPKLRDVDGTANTYVVNTLPQNFHVCTLLVSNSMISREFWKKHALVVRTGAILRYLKNSFALEIMLLPTLQ